MAVLTSPLFRLFELLTMGKRFLSNSQQTWFFLETQYENLSHVDVGPASFLASIPP